MRRLMLCVAVVVGGLVGVRPAVALDEPHREMAHELIDKAIGYLRSQQDESGGWSVPAGEGRPHFPGITALVVNGMIVDPSIGADDPAVAKAIDYLMSYQQEDGGFYDRILAAYNTALTVSAFSKVGTPETAAAMPGAVAFLKSLQWHEGARGDFGEVGRVGREHPFYGGVGYGGSSRPDNSNLNLYLQALHDAGVPSEDPAFQRALVFLSRTQMLDSVNDMDYADGSSQGGFIYATSPSGEEVGVGESKAGVIVETLTDGEEVSRLRAYGSMTYAGFKSLIYADLSPGDERVDAALGWIKRNYTLEENPGIGTDGLYYYYLTFARALDAFGVSELEVVSGVYETEMTWNTRAHVPRPRVMVVDQGGEALLWADYPMGSWGEGRFSYQKHASERHDVRVLGEVREEGPVEGDGQVWGRAVDVEVTVFVPADWQNDFVARLAEMQEEDGSFRVVDDRWMESDPVLITAYALVALQAVVD